MSTVLEHSTAEALFSPEETPYLFSVDEFYRMVDQDIFPEDTRVGLWDGRIYEKMAKKQAHSFSWARLNASLLPLLPPGWSLWAECSITISPDKAPLPDMLILRGDIEGYRDRRPGAEDVGLLIELADSSMKVDTGTKLRAYARAGIPTYWVVNLREHKIHIFHDPISSEDRYASMATIGREGSIPFVLDGLPIAMIPASTIL